MMGAWGATLAVITLRDLGIKVPGLKMNPACKGHRIGGLPAPGDYLATFIVFAPLAMAEGSGSAQWAKAARLFGWAWFLGVVALPCLGTSNPTGKAKQPAPKGNAPGPSAPGPSTLTAGA